MNRKSSTVESRSVKKMRTSETVVAHCLNLNSFSIDKNDYEAISKNCWSRQLVPKVDEAHRVYELKKLENTTLDYFPDSICDLDRLKSLDLGNSQFSRIDDCIGNLQSLEVLGLNNTKYLETLPPSIGKLQNLKFLFLTGTKNLSTLPEEVGNLRSLEELDLEQSEIETIPSSIGNLQNLKRLKLRAAGQLSTLPGEIGNLVALEKLELTGAKKITTIPSSIGRLQNLRTLQLSNLFQLKTLPEEIGNLISLEYLSLASSKITSLPSSVGNLQNLRLLSLFHISTLSDLPIEIGNLANLICLDLEGTKISTLPTSFGQLKNLRYLHFKFGIEWWTNEERDRNRNKIVMFVKQHPSLLYLDGWSGDKEVGEVLLHNRVRCNILKMERTPGQWPYMLKNARKFFTRCSKMMPSYVAFYYRDSSIYEPEDTSISSENAIYRLLTIGRDNFIGALIGRRT